MNVTLLVIFGYLALVLAIGPLSMMMSKRGSREDFFLATRTIGPFLLLMSLFGTHMSAFSLIGATGEGYKRGIGTYGLLASSSALIAPLVFFFIGTRVWKIGKDHGYVTQCQFFRDRWDSDFVGLAMFPLLVLLVIPYLLIGVMGGGIVFHAITAGPPGSEVSGISQGVGSLIVVAVVIGYVFTGGLRGTAWANAFQTLVFMGIGLVSFVAIIRDMGGSEGFLASLRSLAEQVAERQPDRLARDGVLSQWEFLSYTLIPLSVGMFPHVTMHWLTAKRVSTFKMPIVMYPLCVMAVWLPTVLLGTLASAQLTDANPNAVLVILIKRTGDPLLVGLLAAGVLAAVMSSLDSQTLALSEMFTEDVVVHYGGKERFSERTQILMARGFVVAILGVTWLISLAEPGQVFAIGTWCFAGFTALLPVIVAALFWRRSTKWGVLACALTVAVLLTTFLAQAYLATGTLGGGYRPFGLPVHPVAILLAASTVAMIVVSLMTPAPRSETLAKFFRDR